MFSVVITESWGGFEKLEVKVTADCQHRGFFPTGGWADDFHTWQVGKSGGTSPTAGS